MRSQARGFTLLEVMMAVVVLTAVVAALARAAELAVTNVAAGRRWTMMAAAVRSEIGRLEQRYRESAPACAVPPDGGVVTPEGIAVDWHFTGDSVSAQGVVAARAAANRSVLADSVAAGFRCR